MIEKTKWDRDFGDIWEVSCDDCGEVEEIEGDFEDCISFLKEENWKTVKKGYHWGNYCPDCQKKEVRP